MRQYSFELTPNEITILKHNNPQITATRLGILKPKNSLNYVEPEIRKKIRKLCTEIASKVLSDIRVKKEDIREGEKKTIKYEVGLSLFILLSFC